MIDKISILYIDDNIDVGISNYLLNDYSKKAYTDGDRSIVKEYREIQFNNAEGYRSLLDNTCVRGSNVILVDDRLFQERDSAGKFSGTQFKALLRKLFPFIEVVIISQFGGGSQDRIIPKFSVADGECSNLHYKRVLEPELDKAIEEVIEFNRLTEELFTSRDVEELLIEKVRSSLQGDNSYGELTGDDVDNLVAVFNELKASIANE